MPSSYGYLPIEEWEIIGRATHDWIPEEVYDKLKAGQWISCCIYPGVIEIRNEDGNFIPDIPGWTIKEDTYYGRA